MAKKDSKKPAGKWFVAVGEAKEKQDRASWLQGLFDADTGVAVPARAAIVYVTEPIHQSAWSVKNSLPWESAISTEQPARIICVWDHVPVDALSLVSWKDCFLANPNSDHAILVCPPKVAGLDEFKIWFIQQTARWLSQTTTDEQVRFVLGDRVSIMPDAEHSTVSAAFVSMAFGVMEEMLERLEFWRRRYLEQVRRVGSAERKEIHKHLTPILRKSEDDDDADWERRDELEKKLRKVMDDAGLRSIHPAALPVVLLTGETGSGKTLIARYLARSADGVSLPFARVSMPEFESSEHAFEYEVFGYRGGTYSDAPPSGDAGILLNHIGGVVFLDEIGDASRQTQRKLLAYLDDYEVRPRGVHHSIFCPTMVVAATNHDLEKDVAAGEFRRDLYERFDVCVRVPSLNERKPDFEFILDTVLQNPGINPGHRIKELSQPAYQFLLDMDYKDGNFRRIENLLRFGIREALRAGRKRLIKADLEKWQSFQKGN